MEAGYRLPSSVYHFPDSHWPKMCVASSHTLVCLTFCIWTKLVYGRTHVLHFKWGSYVSVWRMTCMLLVRNILAGWAQRLMNVKITAFQEMDLMPRFLKGNCHLRGISFSESLLHQMVGFAQRQKRG